MLGMMAASRMDLRQVYSLKMYYEEHPECLNRIQEQSLDNTKLELGFSPHQGIPKVLYGSPEWWDAIDSGAIETIWREGVIIEKDIQGMDDNRPNTVYYVDRFDGKKYAQRMELNERNKRRHYKLYDIKHYIKICFVRVEYKKQPLLYEPPDYNVLKIYVSKIIVTE